MTRHRLLAAASAVLGGCLMALPFGTAARAGSGALPDTLSDSAFWALSSNLSEPNGFFRSDNLVSNEIQFQHVIPELAGTGRPGRVYLGVGPEQNFTYIAALRPSMAFIIDVRRGNLQLHLMYKALFALSADRAEFVSRLFSKKRPDGLTTRASAAQLFAAYERVETSDVLYKSNLAALTDRLARTRGVPLLEDDVKGVEYVYEQFYWFGPSIQYWSTGGSGRSARNAPTFADLMMADDGSGHALGFLATEENFRFMKELEGRNLLVPVVGNFAGPKALRAIGRYVQEHGAVVSAFYLSNVEQYLGQDGIWGRFCSNVATLPLDESSTFIRSVRNGGFVGGVGLDSELGHMASETKSCGAAVADDLLSRAGALLWGPLPAPRRPAARWRH